MIERFIKLEEAIDYKMHDPRRKNLDDHCRFLYRGLLGDLKLDAFNELEDNDYEAKFKLFKEAGERRNERFKPKTEEANFMKPQAKAETHEVLSQEKKAAPRTLTKSELEKKHSAFARDLKAAEALLGDARSRNRATSKETETPQPASSFDKNPLVADAQRRVEVNDLEKNRKE